MILKVQAPGAFIIKLTDLKCTKNGGIMWKASVLVTVVTFNLWTNTLAYRKRLPLNNF
jgi:hypothetical protein